MKVRILDFYLLNGCKIDFLREHIGILSYDNTGILSYDNIGALQKGSLKSTLEL